MPHPSAANQPVSCLARTPHESASQALIYLQLLCVLVRWGLLFLAVAAVRERAHWQADAFTFDVWASLLYLGVLGTAVVFVWYCEGIRRLGTARTVVFNNLVPVFGVLPGWLVLGEPFECQLGAGRRFGNHRGVFGQSGAIGILCITLARM